MKKYFLFFFVSINVMAAPPFNSIVVTTGAPYHPINRIDYISKSLAAIQDSPRQDLTNLYQTISLLEKNKCRSLIESFALTCLEEEVGRNCISYQGPFKKNCKLISDIVTVNKMNEKFFVNSSEKIKISEQNENYTEALAQALRRKYSLLATEFIITESERCKAKDLNCTSTQLERYCVKNADAKGVSWQACVGALVWFIGTN